MTLVRFSQGGRPKVSVLLPLAAFVSILSSPVPALACLWPHWEFSPGAEPLIIYALLATAVNLLASLLLLEFRGGKVARILKRCVFFVLFSFLFAAGSLYALVPPAGPLPLFALVSLINMAVGCYSEHRGVRIVGILSAALVAGYILFALFSTGTVFLPAEFHPGFD